MNGDGNPTRFYLQYEGQVPKNAPAYSVSWKDTTQSSGVGSLVLDRRDRAVSGGEHHANVAGWAAGDAGAAWMLIGPPMEVQTISGTVKGRTRAAQTLSTAHANSAVIIRVASGDGTTIRGTLLALTAGSASGGVDPECTTAPTATADGYGQNRELPYGAGSPVAISSLAVLQGDRIIIELGFRYQTTTVPSNARLMAGWNMIGGDLPEDQIALGSSVWDNAPWIEFSDDIIFNYPAGKDRISGGVGLTLSSWSQRPAMIRPYYEAPPGDGNVSGWQGQLVPGGLQELTRQWFFGGPTPTIPITGGRGASPIATRWVTRPPLTKNYESQGPGSL